MPTGQNKLLWIDGIPETVVGVRLLDWERDKTSLVRIDDLIPALDYRFMAFDFKPGAVIYHREEFYSENACRDLMIPAGEWIDLPGGPAMRRYVVLKFLHDRIETLRARFLDFFNDSEAILPWFLCTSRYTPLAEAEATIYIAFRSETDMVAAQLYLGGGERFSGYT